MTLNRRFGSAAFITLALLAYGRFLPAGEIKKEVKLTGEYKARLEYSKPISLAVVYGAQIREGSYLTVGGGSDITLRSADEDQKSGSTKFQVTGMCDIFGSEKAPINVRSLNSGKIIIGDTERRDDVKPGPSLTSFRMRYTVIVNTPFSIRNGNVSIEECVFVNSPLWIDGGRQVVVNKCSFINTEGAGLEIVRSDTYPNIVVKSCAFTDSSTGLSLKLGTMRQNRSPCMINECNFERNKSHVFFEDLTNFLLQACYMNEPGPKEQSAFAYPSDAQYKGRIIAQSQKSSPINYAGASLVREGQIKPLDLIAPPEIAGTAEQKKPPEKTE